MMIMIVLALERLSSSAARLRERVRRDGSSTSRIVAVMRILFGTAGILSPFQAEDDAEYRIAPALGQGEQD